MCHVCHTLSQVTPFLLPFLYLHSMTMYDCHILTGKVEDKHYKIKVMKRNAYGFRDERYFELRLYALHDCLITRNAG